METLVAVIVAVVLGFLAFLQGKKQGKKEGKVEDLISRVGELTTDIETGQDELEEVNDALEDNQAREISPDEAIDILRRRHGWDPIDDHAP